MLSQSTIDIVKSTAPLIEQTGPKLTAHFYDRMFQHHPELKDIFNLAHQKSGSQREALFNAVCGYAANIDNLEALLPVVEKIAQKHTSFNITPDQYDIVGEHLLASIDELLNPGEQVLEAWKEAYGVLAQIFINREEEIYHSHESATGGWRGTRKFKVINKTQESQFITSFELEPVDGKPVVNYKPGQYIAVYIQSPEFENQEIRQYSLSGEPNGKTYRISVKREDKGLVSKHLHQSLECNNEISLAAPAGDFFFQTPPQRPVALISGGVGVTPLLSMLESQIKTHKAPIYWLHATENSAAHAFNKEVSQFVATNANLQSFIWYNQEETENTFKGYIELSTLDQEIDWLNTDFYFCGPVAFMQSIAKQLIAKGVNESAIYYECFGPHKVI